MFINGADLVYSLLFSTATRKRMVVVEQDNKISRFFEPENKSKDAIYMCTIYGHMMKLVQVGNIDKIQTEQPLTLVKRYSSIIKGKMSNVEVTFSINAMIKMLMTLT